MQKLKEILFNSYVNFKNWLRLYRNVFKGYITFLDLRVISNRRNSTLIIISLYEHIGDIVACEPVIFELKQLHPNSTIVWCMNRKYSALLKYHPLIDGIVEFSYFSEWIILKKILGIYPKGEIIVDLHINGRKCLQFNKKLKKKSNGISFSNYLSDRSILEAFTKSAGLSPINFHPKFFLNPQKGEKINRPYIVLHTSTNSTIKDWQRSKWQKVAEVLISYKFVVVEIGTVNCITSNSKCFINNTGYLDLQRIATIISDSLLFIGCDSGFAHMANALNINGLILIGEYRLEGGFFRKYNPFSGRFKSPEFIIYSNSGPVSEIGSEMVINRIHDKLKLNNPTRNNNNEVNG